MISFRDPIHGDLSFSGVVEELIATDEFQRLSEVKQLGCTDKVYPGANHTRFSHALGVCYLVGELGKRLGVPKKDLIVLQVAGLLHDIGHYDFSHALEGIAPCDHEENGKRIILGTAEMPGRKPGGIAQVLRRNGIEPQAIVDLLHHKGKYPAFYHTLLSSKVIDCDRMDFLKRDTYFTGAVIGEIDIERLLSVLIVHPKTKELAIQQKGVASLEQFIVARVHMYQQVYFHPDTAAAETMLLKAVESSKKVAMPLMWGDDFLLSRLAEHGTPRSKELVHRLRNGKRSFYVPALIIDKTGSSQHLIEHALAWQKDVQDFERRLLAAAKRKDGEVLVAFPGSHRPPTAEHSLPKFPVLLREGEWADFFDLSPVAKAAMLTRASSIVFVVYSAPEHADAVREAALRLLK